MLNDHKNLENFQKNKLVYIHGITTSGKSTIGNLLHKKLLNLNHKVSLIDQDTFYLKEKPNVIFTNNNIKYTQPNWDCIESVDFDKLNKQIKQVLKKNDYVIVTGFALWFMNDELPKPDINILLNYNSKELINEIIRKRVISKFKNSSEERKQIDTYMVKKVVVPFYDETLKHIGNPCKIDIYQSLALKSPEIICDEIMVFLKF